MRIHVRIEYTDMTNGVVETLVDLNKNNEVDRKLMHMMLDEYLDNNMDFDNEQNGFHVTNRCICHERAK